VLGVNLFNLRAGRDGGVLGRAQQGREEGLTEQGKLMKLGKIILRRVISSRRALPRIFRLDYRQGVLIRGGTCFSLTWVECDLGQLNRLSATGTAALIEIPERGDYSIKL